MLWIIYSLTEYISDVDKVRYYQSCISTNGHGYF